MRIRLWLFPVVLAMAAQKDLPPDIVRDPLRPVLEVDPIHYKLDLENDRVRVLHARLGQGEAAGSFKRTLELNPDHPAVQKLRQLAEANANDPKVETYAKLLLDQATIAEGSTIKDPAAFAKRVNELIAAG